MHARPRTLAAVALAGALALGTTACGDGAGETDQPGTTPAPTVTVTETAGPASPQPSAGSLPATSNPRVTQGADGTCTDARLRVRYADDPGGAGAGNVNGTFTFTNTGDTACTLRGFPGVSYVTGSDGEQVGQPASRSGDTASTVALEPGGSAKASLRRSQPGSYGSDCREADVRGFRVYPPGSRGAVFVAFATTGCRSPNAPLLQVGPVR